MKKHLLILFSSITLGEFFGLVISLSFNYISHSYNYYPSDPTFNNHFASPLDAMLASVILWGLIGLVFGLGAFIFNVKSWSLRTRTIVNFFVYYCGFTPLACLAGWFKLNLPNFILFTLIFIGIYVFIWSFNYYNVKRELTKINQKIRN
ncbi:DUF3021 domain-containing protein [Limosilactobacillus fermentum]|uniref:DUF3021 domain-containing protein n=1 Tax=Limosilactobacillus fermentum TaxID=1613 RepID=UPI0009731701|nr:DUF3021 domain-containing protein [Limosilactobacillus fermentum]WNY94589.1 DUF3021 domain-containing protein [Limosilactobacillus fermentum]WNY96340.1 DUF3021 domain-containing protein [Limosilactobacillus fermentum]BAW87290.1 hypothetical protein LF25067_01635 [Limosilactobacillus fermentum]